MTPPAIKRRTFDDTYQTVTSYSISYNDVFSFSDFISTIHQWLAAEGYSNSDSDFNEVYYLQRESPKTGKNIQIWWRMEKIPDEKKLYKFLFEIDITVRGLQQIEFMSGGKKATADKGDLSIDVITRIQTDPEKHWESHNLLKKYKKFILGKWLKKEGEYKGNLEKEAIKLQDFIKEHLRISARSPQHDAKLWKTRPTAS